MTSRRGSAGNRFVRATRGFAAAVLGLALLSLARVAAAEATSNRFFFVQLTDTHIGTTEHFQRLSRAVDIINGLPMPIECVVLTGDISADNLDRPDVVASGLATLRRLKAPLLALPGNHDLKPRKLGATLAAYTNAFGALSQVRVIRGVTFLLLDTEPLAAGLKIPNYDPLAWLATELKRSAARPAIIFHHTPVVEDFYDNALHPGWPEPATSAWGKLIREHGVAAVIAGHFHRDELHWIGNTPLFVSAPLAGYWGRQGSFRVYEYADGKVSYRTVYLE